MDSCFVVGVDGSPASVAALDWALALAAAEGTSVEALHAWDWAVPSFEPGVALLPPTEPVAAARHTVEQELERCLQARPAEAGQVQARVRTEEGDPGAVLAAASEHAELVVLGRHGQSQLRRRLGLPSLGSVASYCLSRSSAPVAIVHPDEAGRLPQRLVVGVDGSASSERALRWAAEHADATGTSVVAVLCWQLTTLPPPPSTRRGMEVPPLQAWADEATQLLAETVERALPPDAARAVERVELHAPATAGLLGCLRPGDALVLGERGHGGFHRLLLGSVSRQCAEHAPGTVVVVPDRAGRSHH